MDGKGRDVKRSGVRGRERSGVCGLGCKKLVLQHNELNSMVGLELENRKTGSISFTPSMLWGNFRGVFELGGCFACFGRS